MKRILLPALLILSLILAACSAASTPLPTDPQSGSVSTESATPANDSVTRIDEQGAIIIEITPLNLDSPTDTFEFDVVLTTHSIDLSMDLATVSTLSTDTGVSVKSTLWDAPRGGHHVEGTLIFPATKDGKAILDNASELTLMITDVDALSRVFQWTVP